MNCGFPIPSSIQDLERTPYNLLPYPEDFDDESDVARSASFDALVRQLENGNRILRNSSYFTFEGDEEKWMDQDRIQALYTLVRKSTSLAPSTRLSLARALADSVMLLANIVEVHSETVSQDFRDAWNCHVYMMYTFTFFAESNLQEKGQDLSYREHAAVSLLAAAKAMAHRPNILWKLGVVDESVVTLPCRTAYSLLEASTGVLARRSAYGDVALEILEVSLKNGMLLSVVSASLLDLMHSFEHMASLVAELCTRNEPLATEILREISRLDASGMKNVAPCISSLASFRPKMVLKHMPHLLPCLNYEPYNLRIAVVSAIGSILASFADDLEDGDKELATDTAKSRAHLFSILRERVYDCSSYTRSVVLKTWISLIRGKSVPSDQVLLVAQIAIDRLQDKTVLVRKQALQLLSEVLEGNPYMTLLDPEPFRKKLNELYLYIRSNLPKSIRDAHEQADEDSDDVTSRQELEQAALAAGIAEADLMLADASPLSEIEKEYCAKVQALKFTQSALDFIDVYEGAASNLESLMMSNNSTDVTESLRFLVKAKHFHLPCAESGIKKALTLVWSSESGIRDELLSAFCRIFVLDPDSESDKHLPIKEMAKNFLNLVDQCSESDLASIEELIVRLVLENRIPADLFNFLWSVVGKDASKRVPALQLISMGSRADPRIIDSKSRLKQLLDCAFNEDIQQQNDWVLIGTAASALQRAGRARIDLADAKFLALELLMKELEIVAQGERCRDTDEQDTLSWFFAAQQAIKGIFVISPQPEESCRTIVENLARSTFLSGEQTAHPSRLARFFFSVGHIALGLLVYTEDLCGLVRRGNAKRSLKMQEDADANNSGRGEEAESLEAELGLAQEVEADNERRLADVLDKEILTRGLLSPFESVLVRVVANEGGDFKSDVLMQASLLCLCKFMCVSQTFCEKHLPLLFTALQNAPQADRILRANTIVALGDLAFRFPNEVEPYTPRLYACLRDPSETVRRHNLMVLTHLILNDMVKVKGQVCEIALCLRDDDQRIRDMARLLFRELSKRSNNPVYNLLPDIVSQLSQLSIAVEDFRGIMCFLLGYIKKDRQNEMLAEKFCQRFPKCISSEQTADLAFCIAQLKLNERSVKYLYDNFKLYKDALFNEDVKKSFSAIVAKAKKLGKPEVQQLIEDWESKIASSAQIGAENEVANRKAEKAKGTKRSKKSKKPLGESQCTAE